MEANLEQYRVMMTGAQVNKLPELSPEEKKQLSGAYFELFFALTASNWANKGKTLGQAWYTALQQIESWIKAQNGLNPTTLYLKQLFASHKVKWQQVMMNSKNKDQVLECSLEELAAWKSKAAKDTSKNLEILNSIMKKYKEVEKAKSEKPKEYQIAKEQMIKMYMAQIMQKQNVLSH